MKYDLATQKQLNDLISMREASRLSPKSDPVKALIEEYADCRYDLDLNKVVATIREIIRNEFLADYKESLEIARNMRDFWIERADHAEEQD